MALTYASNPKVAQNSPITVGKNIVVIPYYIVRLFIMDASDWLMVKYMHYSTSKTNWNPSSSESPSDMSVVMKDLLHSIPLAHSQNMVQGIWWPVQPQLLEWDHLWKSQLHPISTRISSGAKKTSPATILGDKVLSSWSYSHSDIFGSRGLCLSLMQCDISKAIDVLTRRFDGKPLWLLEVGRA